MKKIKILFISKNIKDYRSASYQYDFYNSLRKNTDLKLYGPGINLYKKSDTIIEIIKKINFTPDIIFIGHNWLSDDKTNFDLPNDLKLNQTKIKKVIFLNKEYVNLDKKIKFIISNNFDLCFTHCSTIKFNKKIPNTDVKFIPFAFNDSRLKRKNYKKNIDIFFSGILQNQNINANQSNSRILIMKTIFYSILDIPLFKKINFKSRKIFWNSIPRYRFSRLLSKFINKYYYIDNDKYDDLISSSKIVINSLSPMGLISPRFYECMAIKSIIFSEDSNVYDKVFPRKYIFFYNSNKNDIKSKLLDLSKNYKYHENLLNEAQNQAYKFHTWDCRANEVVKYLNKIL